jgi:hypothetical protein
MIAPLSVIRRIFFVTCDEKYTAPLITLRPSSSIADPHHSDADPDPTFYSDADQDNTFQFDADPDPTNPK